MAYLGGSIPFGLIGRGFTRIPAPRNFHELRSFKARQLATIGRRGARRFGAPGGPRMARQVVLAGPADLYEDLDGLGISFGSITKALRRVAGAAVKVAKVAVPIAGSFFGFNPSGASEPMQPTVIQQIPPEAQLRPAQERATGALIPGLGTGAVLLVGAGALILTLMVVGRRRR